MSTSTLVEPEIYTEADLEQLSSDGERYELFRGELKPMAPASGEHGRRTARISTVAMTFVVEHDLGEIFVAETGFRVIEEPRTILAPDFAFIVKSRVPDPFPSGFVPVVPDLVLETRSPGDTASAVAEKVRLWLEVGVRVVWELNPRSKVLTVYRPNAEPRRLTSSDVLDCKELLPGFSLALELIFQI